MPSVRVLPLLTELSLTLSLPPAMPFFLSLDAQTQHTLQEPATMPGWFPRCIPSVILPPPPNETPRKHSILEKVWILD